MGSPTSRLVESRTPANLATVAPDSVLLLRPARVVALLDSFSCLAAEGGESGMNSSLFNWIARSDASGWRRTRPPIIVGAVA